MAPRVKPGTRHGPSDLVLSYSDAELAAKIKANAAQSLLSVTGLPRALYQSMLFTNGVRRQTDILRARLDRLGKGDSIEMQRLEHELDMSEEELDLEAEHMNALSSNLNKTQEARYRDAIKQIRALEDVRDTLQAEQIRREDLGREHEYEQKYDDGFEDNTPPPELEDDPFVAEPDDPYVTEPLLEDHPIGGWGEIEMGALKAREVPFGSNVSRVLKVGKKFAPKMTAKMIEMGEDAVKKMGWVSEVMEDGTEAFMVRAGTWALELGLGATIGTGLQMVGEALGSKQAGTWLSFAGASAAALIDGNPTFLAVTGLAYGISSLTEAYAKQQARMRQTDRPEAEYGHRFGFVRDGKKWYPAYQAVDIDMYGGLGVDRNDVVMVYGENFGKENLHFMMDSDSKLRPTWTKWHKIKILREPRDKDLKGETSTLAGQHKDALRDWYFLSPSESAQLLDTRGRTAMYKDFSTHNDNVDSYNRMGKSKQSYASVQAYQKNLLDLKYSVDLMRDYNFRFHKDYGTGLGITEAARGLQRTAQWMTGDTTDDGEPTILHYNRVSGVRSDKHLYSDKLGHTPDDLHKKWGDLKENDWLLSTVLEQMTDLVTTQKLAAQEAGYPPVTTEYKSPMTVGPDGQPKRLDSDKHYIDTDIPYRAYMDLGKALPTAHSSDELEAQLAHISGMTDRTYLQQNYLAQKAYTRYLMQQVNVRGGSNALVDKLYYPVQTRLKHEVITKGWAGSVFHEDWGKERYHNYDDSAGAMLLWDEKEGNQYLPPWATSDDQGIMPGFMQLDKHNAKRVAENERTLKLSSAEHLPLSHTNGAAPDKLYSFTPDDVHMLKAQDTRTHLDWQRKNPWALASGRPKYGTGKVRGFFPYFKSGEEKAARLARISKQFNAYHGADVLVHNPYDKDDSYFAGGWRWSTDHYVKDGAGPKQFVMNPMHGAQGPPVHRPEDIVVDPTKRQGYYKGRPGWGYDVIAGRYKRKAGKKDVNDQVSFDNWKSSFGGHGDVDPEKTKWEKQGDHKGASGRKAQLEKERYTARFKASMQSEIDRKKALALVGHAPKPKPPPSKDPIIVLPKRPLPPPKHVVTPWHQPVHDHMIHGPLPGSSTSTSHIVMHHDPEPTVYEDSAPAFIPRTGVSKMSTKP